MKWPVTTLGSLIELQRGHDLPVQHRIAGVIPVVGATGILGRHQTAKYLGPGVLIGRSGVIGGALYVNEPYWPLNTTLFVKDFRGNNPRWVYYLLKTIDFSGFNSGSAQPSLNRNYIAKIEVMKPTVKEQCAIAATLGALDDKIESNRRAIKTIEDLLQADFKAVLEQHEFTLLSFDDVVNRLPVNHKHSHGSVGSRGRIAVLDQSELGILGYHDRDAEFVTTANNPLCLFGDHTCSWRLGIGSFDVGPNVIPITTSSVSGVHNTWLYFSLLGAQDFQEYRRHWMELKRHAIPWVSYKVQDLFVTRATALLQYWSYLLAQSRRLADLRDALLPELLSGRIKVPEAREIVI